VNPAYVGSTVGANVVQGPAFYSMLGTIGTIRGNAVSVIPEEGSPITINTTPNTTIVLNSQQSTLANLRPSDRVKVRYDQNLKAMTLVAVR
jgi:hypothetical protein